ncbi:unnamed protein product [Orchesella dallaii]|uniref:BTB domain-containing protein n=1 Tax=Orchesella dallaii TaxID=48710 RepID=A0ABP1PZW1_9HEXA
MGVYVANEKPIKVKFIPSQKQKDKVKIFSYEGKFSSVAKICVTDNESVEDRNMYRIIDTFLVKKKCWRFHTKLSITRQFDESGVLSEHVGIVRVNGDLIKELCAAFRGQLQVSLTMNLKGCCKVNSKSEKDDMKIDLGGFKKIKTVGYVEKKIRNFNFAPEPYSKFCPRKNQVIFGNMTLEVKAFSNISIESFPINFDALLGITEPGKTFILNGYDGPGMPIDKDILIDRSQFFKKFFSSTADWSVNNTFRFEACSGAVVEAFVNFLLACSYDAPSTHPPIAVQLLKMGHFYEVACLEQSMVNILLGKNWFWFDLETAWKLLDYASQLRDNSSFNMQSAYIKMHNKAKAVLKSYHEAEFLTNTNNFTKKEELQVKQFMEELQKNPSVADELGIEVNSIFS